MVVNDQNAHGVIVPIHGKKESTFEPRSHTLCLWDSVRSTCEPHLQRRSEERITMLSESPAFKTLQGNIMKITFRRAGLALASAGLVAIYGCSGGGSTPATPSSSLAGTVAAGAAVEGAIVQISDGAGDNACSNATGTPPAVIADVSGHYQCTLIGTAVAPFAIVGIDPAGIRTPMVSMVTSRPAAGQTSTVNVSPLTTAVAAMLAPNNDPLAIVPQTGDSPAQKTQRAQSLATAAQGLAGQTTTLVTQLTPAIVELGLDPATFNPFSTAFTPANTAGAIGDMTDKFLDVLKVDFSLGVPTIATTFTAAVQVAPAGAATPPTVTAGGMSGTFSASELDFVRAQLQACFALPAGSRVPNGTTNATVGGATRSVLMLPVATACQGIVVDDAPSGATGGLTFLNNGQPASLWFKDVMTDATMDGAKFSVVDVMRVFPQVNGNDIAFVNIRWIDSAGLPGGMILRATKFPGSRASGTQWWLTGNQHPVYAYVKPWQTRVTQLANVSQPGFGAVRLSQYATGLNLYIDKDDNNPNTAGLTAARVTGPGLPTAGLVMANPPVGDASSTLGVLRKNGDVSSISGNTSGNLYRLQGTAGINGASANTLAPFINAGVDYSANLTSFAYTNLAHPTDFGLPINSNYIFDVSTIPAWSIYTFELFYNNSTTPTYTFTSRIVTPIPTATSIANQQWQDLDSATLSLLDPANLAASGQQTSFTVTWLNNPLADRVTSVGAETFATSPRNANSNNIPKGTYSATLNAPAVGPFWGLTSTGTTQRTFRLRYVRTDGTYKDSVTRYN